MHNPRDEDHLVGLELELVELVEKRERARVQHQPVDAGRIEHDIHQLQEEMAATAENLAGQRAPQARFHLSEIRSA
ncbi:MAG: hypothetical protein ABIW46_00865 [Acidimicrobiales bacterium]